MKKKYSFKNKLKVCRYWLFGHGEAITVHCGICQSTELTFLESNQINNIYTSKYKCRRCGATATNKEEWHKS